MPTTASEHLIGSADEYAVVPCTTLEICVYEVIRINREPLDFGFIGDAPCTEPIFARILVRICSLVFASRPPPRMGAYVMNPKPALL